jgi:hypothetical protein
MNECTYPSYTSTWTTWVTIENETMCKQDEVGDALSAIIE